VVAPAAGSVVLVPFPFSDLSRSKLRPAVVLAEAGHGDWILCQVTSSPYADPAAVRLTNDDFSKGSLRVESYARPGKLFTANRELIVAEAGVLSAAAFDRVRDAVVGVLRPAPRG
jgi:mRNA interferase MazF